MKFTGIQMAKAGYEVSRTFIQSLFPEAPTPSHWEDLPAEQKEEILKHSRVLMTVSPLIPAGITSLSEILGFVSGVVIQTMTLSNMELPENLSSLN